MSKHDSIEQFLNEITFEIERQADNPNMSRIELNEAFKSFAKKSRLGATCDCTKLTGILFYIWKKLKNRNNAICLRNIKIMPEVSD